MRTEEEIRAENEYQFHFMVRIRKDGTIKLPVELEWKPGDMLSLDGYGFKDSYFLLHLRKSMARNIELAKDEAQAAARVLNEEKAGIQKGEREEAKR